MTDSSSKASNNPRAPKAPNAPKKVAPRRGRYVPAVGPRLRVLLIVVLVLFSLLGVNSLYLSAVKVADAMRGDGGTLQNYFYMQMFLGHLVLGLLITLPVVLFGLFHIRNAHNRPNRRAVRAGYALFTTALVLLITGILLTRIEGVIQIKKEATRGAIYWIHVISPLVAIWLFVLHRLAGKKIKWKVGLGIGAVGGAFALVMVFAHSQDPTQWNVEGPESGEQYFFPSLARTDTGNFIPQNTLMMDNYCQKCHPDIHDGWAHSVHRFSSFNNPAYLFSVKETRQALMARDGNVRASRFCAGCHDPLPFFSGAFDDPKFDDPEYDLASDPTAQAGITCTVCHAITNLNSPRGNSDYTISEPVHYPFAFSENRFLQWVNNQLVKAKPGLHKKTFLKPLHKTPEFCGTCHKVHLPEELNHYKFLRGQNHYDSYHLSGVSGHGISSFYYPPKAEHDCNGCHMQLAASDDFGARDFQGTGELEIHGHQFPSANTAIPYLLRDQMKDADGAIAEHQKFLEGVMRLDIFGLKSGGSIDAPVIGPIRPQVPALEPGGTYLVETVIRTMKMGHLFTQGTADSNEVWLDITVSSGDRILGRSGGLAQDGAVDPWSHFVNAYILDRNGRRIDRRNAEDIFVPLYSNQIPPGAADSVHYAFRVPTDVVGPVTIEAKLQYRKFDTTYMQYVYGPSYVNDLPITTLAVDRVTFPHSGTGTEPAEESSIPEWMRWNDYGIGLLRKGTQGSSKGELRQAEAAFLEVEKLGRGEGPLNRARTYLKEGRVDEAAAALERARSMGAYPWSVEWFAAQVNRQNGFLDEAIQSLENILGTQFQGARERELDFGQDYRVINVLGMTLFDRAKQERSNPEARRTFLRRAVERFEETLALDPENVTAHYNLAIIQRQLGNEKLAQEHQRLHSKYKPDENARDTAVAIARRSSDAADHAAEAIVIYDLQRPGAYELGAGKKPGATAPTEEGR